MCDCINNSSVKLIDAVIGQLKEKGTKIVNVNYEASGFVDSLALVFNSNVPRKLFFPLTVVYTPEKKGGAIGREKKDKINIFFSYCPFCGEKYPEDSNSMKPVEEDAEDKAGN